MVGGLKSDAKGDLLPHMTTCLSEAKIQLLLIWCSNQTDEYSDGLTRPFTSTGTLPYGLHRSSLSWYKVIIESGLNQNIPFMTILSSSPFFVDMWSPEWIGDHQTWTSVRVTPWVTCMSIMGTQWVWGFQVIINFNPWTIPTHELYIHLCSYFILLIYVPWGLHAGYNAYLRNGLST